MIRTQLSVMPDGTTYFSIARTVRKAGGGHLVPQNRLAIELGCEAKDAHQIVYADGIDLDRAEAAVPVGVTCRLCERTDCRQRAFPPMHQRLEIDENVRGLSFYAAGRGRRNVPAMGTYRILDDIAIDDLALEIEGDTLADVFATAARALAEQMVDPATLVGDVRHTIELSAETRELLLFDWLAELIFRKDRDGEVFSRAEVEIAGEAPASLVAQVEGGAIDPERTKRGADPKAVTFHRFGLERQAAGGARAW